MQKKFVSLALALVMCLGLCIPALAAEAESTVPSHKDALRMVDIGWDMGSNFHDLYVLENVNLRGTDGAAVTCPGYFRVCSDVNLSVVNNSGRDDCRITLELTAYENDGTGVYTARTDWGSKLEQGEEALTGVSLGKMEPEKLAGKDVIVGMNILIQFQQGEESTVYPYPVYFKLGAAERYTPPVFTDVKGSDYYAEPVSWAVKNRVTTGTGDGTKFSPSQTCTNAQILTFLYRAYGEPAPTVANPFSNVKESDFYYGAALWAYEKGMVSGTTFDADKPCTRAMTVTYIWQAAGSPAPVSAANFTDVDAGAAYAQAVAWAVEQPTPVTTGTGDGTTFSPDQVCSRGEIVTFLYRALAK